MQTQELPPSHATFDDMLSGQVIANEPSIIDRLSGRQKATALLVAMGQSAASRLIKYFNAEDLRCLSGQAKSLPDIDPIDFEKLVGQFEESFAQGVSVSHASERFTSLLQENLTEDEVAAVLDPQSQTAITIENIFETMARMDAETLASLVAAEHPQVSAYLISRLPSELAARILLAQTATMRADIVQRSLYLRGVSTQAENLLSNALRPTLSSQLDGGGKSHYKQIATILNQLGKAELDEVLVSLSGIEPQDLKAIKDSMFAFDDIADMADRSRRLLFDELDSQLIVQALRGADEALVELVLSGLSQRTRRMVEAESKTEDSATTPELITQAQRDIAQVALNLADQGKISLKAE